MIPICSRDVIECMATSYRWVLLDYVEREEAEIEDWRGEGEEGEKRGERGRLRVR